VGHLVSGVRGGGLGGGEGGRGGGGGSVTHPLAGTVKSREKKQTAERDDEPVEQMT